jgi:anhydro-N-acetylmuramic acid kinase
VKKNKTSVIGIMSGSSLDGLDMACCEFDYDNQPQFFDWKFVVGEFVPFDAHWKDLLSNTPNLLGSDLYITDVNLGKFIGEEVRKFCLKNNLQPDLIASHGHTVFHYPDKGVTCQIGDGSSIAAQTGIPVANNFRTMDMAYRGQGAPLAPLADQHLFPGFDFYLNIGGIVNISAPISTRQMIAFDITGANQILNGLANLLDKEYDENGDIAASGQIDYTLLKKANAFGFLTQDYPKSLGNDIVKKELTQLFVHFPAPVENKLCTATEHIAGAIAETIDQIIRKEHFIKEKYHILITGGGAFNQFLLKRLQYLSKNLQITVPDKNTIIYKEAMLMALMGYLRLHQVPNCFSSATGADKDVIGGALFIP